VRVLVTGGGGFLGSELARQLLAEDIEVLVLGRRFYPHLPAEICQVRADIRDAPAVSDAFSGCDAVFHAAAVPGIWGPASMFRAINVRGTENVINACLDNHIDKLIFTSSPSVVFAGGDMENSDESVPYPNHYLSEYARTKAEAERLVLESNGHSGLLTVALRPHLIWGAGDPHLVPRLLKRARSGRLVQVGRGHNKVDLVHVKNAARAHIQAWRALGENPAKVAGRCYFISDRQPVRLWGWVDELLKSVGLPTVRRSVPLGAAYAAGAMLEAVYGLFGIDKEPPMTRFLAQQLGTSHYFNISRAVEDFGYRPVMPPEEGFRELIRSLLDRPAG
jgi:nucleoside-diphosphate-sugar epimerase